ncbi:MAG: hypothetical protein E4G91_03865 [Candidatus Zixiibacteriota bacterium]|nr:MAG: hypothetical protein E4G91_03865 [candidate division Zixibacteria bacterium]
MKYIAVIPQGRSLLTLAIRSLLCLLWLGSLASLACGEEPTAVTRGDFGNVTVMELTGNFDANLADGTSNSAPRMALATEFYRTHQDNYDFLIFFTNFDYQMLDAETAGFYMAVSNDIRGIGIDLFDFTDLFGSAGKLQGTIDMRSLAANGTSPLDPEYSHTLNTLEHEILHRWSAHARFIDADGKPSDALLGRGGA